VTDQPIYLDHAAATPVDSRVLLVMQPFFSDQFYNPSSPYAPAVAVRRIYEQAKHDLARSFGAKADEIVITAGATESINLAFGSVSGHVVTSNIEHQATLAAASRVDHSIVEANSYGIVEPEIIKAAITPATQLVSISLANNELGSVQPIRDIAFIVKDERQARLMKSDSTPIYLHVDASQGVGQVDCNVARLGIDMMTINAGKIYGPKQVGLLWAASHVNLTPQILGGGQERGLRSGTENVAGTIGFAKALSLAVDHRKHEAGRLQILRDKMQNRLVEAFPDAVISGHPKHRLAGHLHIAFSGLDAERLVFALESRNVLVATGSACAANKGTRSHVLTAIGMSPEVADGSLRLTFGHLSDEENSDQATQIIIEEIQREYKRVGE
jgi:cysteine desulfurase